MDKQGKFKTKIMIRNHKDDGASNSHINHSVTIKVYDNERDVLIPVFIELDKTGKIQIPVDVSKDKDNVSFINSKNRILKRLLNDEGDTFKEYWELDSTNPRDMVRMKEIQVEMENKYPFKKEE